MFQGITTILPVLLRGSDTAELKRAVDSVLAQKCALPVEVLVVDDGSEPAVALPGIRVVRLPRNYGIAHALNVGLTQAKYDLIARIDADDVWRPGKLAKQLAMFEADGDLTLAASSLRLAHREQPGMDRDELRGGDWVHALSLTESIGCPFPHGSVLARRDVFETLGGYPQAATSQHAEDFALWAQWMRFFKVSIADEVFLDYTMRGDQISSRFAREQERASLGPRRMLAALKERTRVPEAVREVASALGVPMLEASKRLFMAWRYYEYIVAGPAVYSAVADLLPDRAVHRPEDVSKLLADRVLTI